MKPLYITSNLKVEVHGYPEGWSIFVNKKCMLAGVLPAVTSGMMAQAVNKYLREDKQ